MLPPIVLPLELSLTVPEFLVLLWSFLENTKEKLENAKDFSYLANPGLWKTLENEQTTLKKTKEIAKKKNTKENKHTKEKKDRVPLLDNYSEITLFLRNYEFYVLFLEEVVFSPGDFEGAKYIRNYEKYCSRSYLAAVLFQSFSPYTNL